MAKATGCLLRRHRVAKKIKKLTQARLVNERWAVLLRA